MQPFLSSNTCAVFEYLPTDTRSAKHNCEFAIRSTHEDYL
jgi:hypothetical protein